MDIFRVENNVPTVYCNDSRDFQLLARLYTAVVGGVKFDIDTIKNLTSTDDCRNSVLELLATKLGFLTNRDYEDDKLRYILSAFPVMVKNKGSLLAIKQAVNMFLKIYNIRTRVTVWCTQQETMFQGKLLPDHTVIIGLDSQFIGDEDLLRDVFRFILPAGFGFYVYYYQSLNQQLLLENTQKATLIYVSDNINSNVRTCMNSEYTSINGNKYVWPKNSIKCSNANLTVDIDWQKFNEATKQYKYGVYHISYLNSSWEFQSGGIMGDEYGVLVQGTPEEGDTITVYTVTDELVGAVDTVSISSKYESDKIVFDVGDLITGSDVGGK